MADKLNWGILATGNIAHQFASGLKKSKTGRLAATGSRTQESAKAFADKHGGKAYGSYEALLEDPEIDAVYISLPHHLHYDWTIKTAQAKKAILCEKPFTLNALEAQRALNEVKANKVFFMEAFMYRCHPQTLKISELLANKAIGEPLMVSSEFGYAVGRDWQNFRAEGSLGGGGLMDVGTYCVSFSRLVAGEEPIASHFAAQIGERGYDESGAGCMKFPTRMIAHFGTAVHVQLRNDATIYGSDGVIHVPNPWKCSQGGMTIQKGGRVEETFDLKSSNDELYAIEADAVAQYLDEKECPFMNWEDTLNNMRTLDALRSSAGLKFSSEMSE
jgi:predicted dehydrogenase